MPMKPDPNIRRRNRLIVAAAKSGMSYAELARAYGKSAALILKVCHAAGVRKRARRVPCTGASSQA